MNWLHVHLILNHIPIFGSLLGVVILMTALIWKSGDLKRFSLYYFVGLGVVGLVVYLTGEPAEEAVEHMAGFAEAAIESHEEAAVFGLVALAALAVFSLLGALPWPKARAIAERGWYFKAILALAILSTGITAWIGNLGGKIRHTEVEAVSQSEIAPAHE